MGGGLGYSYLIGPPQSPDSPEDRLDVAYGRPEHLSLLPEYIPIYGAAPTPGKHISPPTLWDS